MVKEKSCEPCIFLTWKPKEPILEGLKEKPDEKDLELKKTKPLQCYPGMVMEKGACPAEKKRLPPKWSEVYPNNVCMCVCEPEPKKPKAVAKLDKEVITGVLLGIK